MSTAACGSKKNGRSKSRCNLVESALARLDTAGEHELSGGVVCAGSNGLISASGSGIARQLTLPAEPTTTMWHMLPDECNQGKVNMFVVREESEYFVIELPPGVPESPDTSLDSIIDPSNEAFYEEDAKEAVHEDVINIKCTTEDEVQAHAGKRSLRRLEPKNSRYSKRLLKDSALSKRSPDCYRAAERAQEATASQRVDQQTRCVGRIGLLLFTLLPLGDVISDIVVTAVWYARGDHTYFWLSIAIFVWSSIMANSFAWATGRGNLISGSLAGCCPLSVIQLCEIWSLEDTWDPNSATGSRMTFLVLGELVCEALPQIALQTYVLLHDHSPVHYDPARRCEHLLVSFTIGMTTVASGIVGIYLSWEKIAVQICSVLFFMSIIFARCGALVMFVMKIQLYALVLPLVGLATRVYALVHFKVVTFDDIPVITQSSSSTQRRVTEEEHVWAQWMNSITTVTSWLHTLTHDAICLSPFLVALLLVPFGARIYPGLNVDGHRYEGIKRMIMCGGASVNTFRNRLESDFAIAMIMLHIGENLLMILVSVSVSYARSSLRNSFDLIWPFKIVFLPMIAAAFLYFTTMKLVARQETRWISDVKLAKDTNLVDQVTDRNVNLLVKELNKAGSLWNNFIVKQTRGPSQKTVFCHLPELIRFCCEKYRGPAYDYVFDGIDALMFDLDHTCWDTSNLAPFGVLGLRGLCIGNVEENELDKFESTVRRIIKDDDVRPKLRLALENLAMEIETRHADLYTTDYP